MKKNKIETIQETLEMWIKSNKEFLDKAIKDGDELDERYYAGKVLAYVMVRDHINQINHRREYEN